MAKLTLHDDPINSAGDLPSVGTEAPNFTLTKNDLSPLSLTDIKGKRVVLNIFPSIDTGTCANSVRRFNKEASGLDNTMVLCISKDLPFAQKRFCDAEGIDNLTTLSDYKNENFGTLYSTKLIDGPLCCLHSRAIVVIDQKGTIIHTEQVEEIVDQPNYSAALEVLK